MNKQELKNGILGCIRNVIGEMKHAVHLHEPVLGDLEKRYLSDCIDSGFVSSVGAYVNSFERRLEELTNAKYAVAVVNGTAALQISLLAAGVEAGDEVLVPALSFVATANAVAYVGAKPLFYDCEPAHFGVNLDVIRNFFANDVLIEGNMIRNRHTGRRIRAMIVMHTLGIPVQLQEIKQLTESYGIPLIEDAAEAVGSYYQNQHVGTFGQIGCFSFNGNKIITSGGGGAIVTNDEQMARTIRHLSTTAKQAHAFHFYHDQLGYNFRMPNINAALACAQLDRLDDLLAAKRALALRYQESFQTISGVRFVSEATAHKSNYWLNAIVLDPEYAEWTEYVIEQLHAEHIFVRPFWRLLNELPHFQDSPKTTLIHANAMFQRTICLPSSSFL